MQADTSSGVVQHFSKLPDPRLDRRKKHRLTDIVVISICAIICGADSWEDIAAFGTIRLEWFKTFLDLPHGIPSHDTFSRVFSLLDPKKFGECFIGWMESLAGSLEGKNISIDGKTLRHSFDRASLQNPLHIVNVWCQENHLVLGQLAVDDKSNEITAVPKILELLAIKGSTITFDAMHTQRDTAKQIVDAKADYLMVAKGNQGTLSNDICLAFDGADNDILTGRMQAHLQTFDKGHGRIEERNYWLTDDIAWLQSEHKWPGLKSIGIAETRIEDLAGVQISKERRYFLVSFKDDIARFAKAVRGHWGVEAMHWTLDMSFGEDQSRIRKNHSPQNFSAMRKIALNLLKNTNLEFDGKIRRASVRGKRKVAGWDNAFLMKVLFSSKF